jgi:hypothetical protein
MKTNARLWFLTSACTAAVLGLVLSINSAETVAAGPIGAIALPGPTPTVNSQNVIQVTASGGLRIATFEAKSGRVLLILPDDMRAGDTISGTVQVEPAGKTEEERANNLNVLNGHTIIIRPQPKPGKPGENAIELPVKLPTFTVTLPPQSPRFVSFGIVGQPPGQGGDFIQDTWTVIPDLTLNVTMDSRPPQLGQQGRPLQIPGSFDGSFDNTTVRFGPPGSTVQDFEKNTQNVSGGFGLIKPLAESPRKIVFESPTNVVGPIQVFVQEGDKKTTAPFRNLGVQLSAPKTNLMRGEKTTLTVEVRGLEGIKEDVPLQLDSRGVITMDGGNFQNLRIKPNEVQRDGRYTTTRGITGQQAGGFNVTATVIVNRFDFCLQDDADPNRILHFNSFTGDYFFACGGGSCRPGGSTGGTQTGGTPGKPGGTVQPGGTPPGGTGTPPIVPPTGLNLTGIGKPTMKGCIITLGHYAPDRRIFANLDVCTKSGEASVQTNSPKAEFKITDKNIADNSVASPK